MMMLFRLEARFNFQQTSPGGQVVDKLLKFVNISPTSRANYKRPNYGRNNIPIARR